MAGHASYALHFENALCRHTRPLRDSLLGDAEMPAEAGKTTGCLDGCCERVIHDRECKDALDAMSSDSCLSLAVKESENIAMTKEIGEALRAARRRKGLNQAEVGRLVGVSRQAVGQWENGETAPSTRNLVQLADIYGVDVGALTSRQVAVKSMPFIGKDEPYMSFVVDQRPAFDDMPPDVRDEEVEHMRKLAEKPYEMRSDVPVRGTVIGGSEDEFILENEVIDFVRRPPGIQNARNVYALYVVNDSMIPRFEPGDLVYVSPSREPTRGDYVIVQLFNSGDKTHSENGPALIKRLRKRTAEIVVLIQFNPPTELEFHVSEIRAIHRVIPTNELFGV